MSNECFGNDYERGNPICDVQCAAKDSCMAKMEIKENAFDEVLEIMGCEKHITRIDTKTKSKLNVGLYPIGKKLWNKIPLDTIFEIIAKEGILPIQEDNTEWSGLLCGATGRAMFNLADKHSFKDHDGFKVYTPITNSVLVLSWYKFETGKYEIVIYIS